ncbi:DUF4326 domain-containing protein [Streptomyces daliensis]|uniref:DUF4326 domain-containing protein n=1 Tax=Streptomyces daliensis TaxID=299421 RepID=A0A8T4IVI2_9ACTN|nr:DUF4326 domain-containing protein [Streptomyces daliensis]
MPTRLSGTVTDALPLSGTCVYVGPRSEYENRFRAGDRAPSVAGTPMDAAMAVGLFAATLQGPVGRCYASRFARDLHGFDLMCTCPLDVPCHADVLLDLANALGAGTTSCAPCTTEGPR